MCLQLRLKNDLSQQPATFCDQSYLVAVGRGYDGLPSCLEHDQTSRLSQVGLSQVTLDNLTGQNITMFIWSGQVRLGWIGSDERSREPLDAINLACRHEPPRFPRQTKPPLGRNIHAQYIKMCLCNTGGFFKLVF